MKADTKREIGSKVAKWSKVASTIADQEKVEVKEDEKAREEGQKENEPSIEECEAAFVEKFLVTTSSDGETDLEDDSEDDLKAAQTSSRHKRNSDSSGEEESCKELTATRRRHTSKRMQRFLVPYQRPPATGFEGLSEVQRKEAAFFQRKMRAFRNLKNHLLTAKLGDLEEEASRKNWGKIPKRLRKNRPKFDLMHIEVIYHLWPTPFEEVEKVWLSRHLKEFEDSWAVDDDQVMSSPLITPYMKYLRCYPDERILQLKDFKPCPNRPPKYQLEVPMTGNLITDAKTILTMYGMHRMKEWETHDNVDYDIMDFQVLTEEMEEAARVMIDKLKQYQAEERNKRRRTEE